MSKLELQKVFDNTPVKSYKEKVENFFATIDVEWLSSLKKALTVDDSEKKPQQSEQLSKKSQDLFDELFGDKK